MMWIEDLSLKNIHQANFKKNVGKVFRCCTLITCQSSSLTPVCLHSRRSKVQCWLICHIQYFCTEWILINRDSRIQSKLLWLGSCFDCWFSRKQFYWTWSLHCFVHYDFSSNFIEKKKKAHLVSWLAALFFFVIDLGIDKRNRKKNLGCWKYAWPFQN